MSRAKSTAPKAGKAERAALAHQVVLNGVAMQARHVARGLFGLSDDPEWRAEVVKALRLAFDLGSELVKLEETAKRRVESAKWQDRQPDLPLEDDDNDA